MRDIRNRLLEEFKDPGARREYADEFLDTFIALQIKALRQDRDWSQDELGQEVPPATPGGEKMKQQQVSQLEKTDYSSWTIQTLKRIAAAFDLTLRVRFESFGELINDVERLNRKFLERPSFKDDPAFREAEPAPLTKALVYQTGASSANQPPNSVRPTGQVVGSSSS